MLFTLNPMPRRKRRLPTLPLLTALALLALMGVVPNAQADQAAKTPLPTVAKSALYIANVGDGSIMRCDAATGKVLATLGQGLNPVGLAIGPDHSLYVTSFGDGTVDRFNLTTGKSLGTFIPKGRGGLDQPVTMAFGADGNLYVGDWKNNDIRRYNGKTGAFLGVFVPHGSGGLVNPGDITFGPHGDLYVTNNSANDVLRFDGKTGASKGTFVKPGSGGLKDPQNIAFGPSGNLFVGGAAGVLEYADQTGAFKRVFAPSGPHLASVGGLTFGPAGNLYVGDWRKNEVVRYNGKTGAFLGVFVPPSSGLVANRYILFGPRGGGGLSPALAAAARAKRQKAAQAVEATAEAKRPALLTAGTTAPDFAAIAPDGTTVHLSDFKGKPVVLDFWATWCVPCQMSMPHLEKVYEQVKDQGVAVLGVCVWDNRKPYDKWVAEKKGTYTFPTAFDPAGQNPTAKNIAGDLYHVSGIPTQYIIDKDGKVIAANVGYDQNDHRLETALDKLGVTVKDQSEATSQ